MNLSSTLEKGPNRGAVSADNTCTAPTITRMSCIRDRNLLEKWVAKLQ